MSFHVLQVVSIAGTTVILKNLSEGIAYWMPDAPVALVGPRGPTGTNYFSRDANNNITYTDGSTNVSQLNVNSVDYNKLPMGLLKQTTFEAASTNALVNYDGFPTNSGGTYLIGSVQFTTVGPTGPRNVRTHINLNVAETGTSTTWRNAYFTLYDDTTIINRFKKHYRESEFVDTFNFYHYDSIDSGTTKTYKLYGSSTSGTFGSTSTLHVSGNVGAYDGTTAPDSYVTVEDLGLGQN